MSEEVKVSLDGFSRYEIYPSGRIIDIKAGRLVIFNRHGNFIMYPDVEEFDKNGAPKHVVENIQMLIADLRKQGIAGFEDAEIAKPKEPDFFASLRAETTRGHLTASELDINELHKLRSNLKKASDYVLKKHSSLEEMQRAQAIFVSAQALLDDFKTANPEYYRWEPYSNIVKVDPKIIDDLKKEEIELKRQQSPILERLLQLKILLNL